MIIEISNIMFDVKLLPADGFFPKSQHYSYLFILYVFDRRTWDSAYRR